MMTMRLLTTLERVLQSSSGLPSSADARTWPKDEEGLISTLEKITTFEAAANVVLASVDRKPSMPPSGPWSAEAFRSLCLDLSRQILNEGIAEFNQAMADCERGVDIDHATASDETKRAAADAILRNMNALTPERTQRLDTLRNEQDIAFHLLRCAFLTLDDKRPDADTVEVTDLMVSIYRYHNDRRSRQLCSWPRAGLPGLSLVIAAMLEETNGSGATVENMLSYIMRWVHVDVDGDEWGGVTDEVLCTMLIWYGGSMRGIRLQPSMLDVTTKTRVDDVRTAMQNVIQNATDSDKKAADAIKQSQSNAFYELVLLVCGPDETARMQQQQEKMQGAGLGGWLYTPEYYTSGFDNQRYEAAPSSRLAAARRSASRTTERAYASAKDRAGSAISGMAKGVGFVAGLAGEGVRGAANKLFGEREVPRYQATDHRNGGRGGF